MPSNLSSAANIRVLPFGIPQLDELFGYANLVGGGLEATPEYSHCVTQQTSLSIVGPDGTGKSVFALHLAATYAAINAETLNPPRIIYVSSDLKFEAAHTIWRNFCLQHPWDRFVPFISKGDLEFRRKLYASSLGKQCTVELGHFLPGQVDKAEKPSITDLLIGPGAGRVPQVAFLDLAGATAGDDWLFVNRLLALAEPAQSAPPSLLVVDSVAGFEALVGDRNSFGEVMSRRARIAQLVRTARDKWHTVFVVEEPPAGEHHPEEYVTDTVLHLRRHGKADKMRRTLEVEKCRAQAFGHGEHPFEIRSGRGASTGNWEHPDDPYAIRRRFVVGPNSNGEPDQPGKGELPYNAYVQVFPSLSYLSQSYGEASQVTRFRTGEDEHPPLGFGIPSLDELLHRQPVPKKPREYLCGLPAGSVTSLSGDEGTRKSRLSEQFLEEAFSEFPAILGALLHFVEGWMGRNSPEVTEFFAKTSEPSEAGKAEANRALMEKVYDNASKPGGDEAKIRKMKALLHRWKAACRAAFRKKAGLSHGTQIRILERLYTCPRLNPRTDGKLLEDLLPETEGEPFRWRTATQPELEVEWKDLDRPLLRRWDAKHYYIDTTSDSGGDARVSEAERRLVMAVSLMRLNWGILTPVVYVATSDAAAERIVTRIVDRQDKAIRQALKSAGFSKMDLKNYYATRYKLALQRLLERFILVRRIELSDASAPQLWHIISRNVVQALYMLGHTGNPVSAVDKVVEYAETVRVLISDLRLVRETYPQVRDDPLFLATLVFRLRRLGVTSLIVDSDTGRPGRGETNPFSAALRSLADHQIYTWNVPFFGEERVAISVIPPMNRGPNGVIRELRFRNPGLGVSSEESALVVDPHFELYAGLEDGRPEPVPLKVVFYRETDAMAKYVEADPTMFPLTFAPVKGSPLIQLLSAREYSGLKDYCQMPTYTRLDHTLVFMIDDYWASAPNGALRSQEEYLLAPIKPAGELTESDNEEHAETIDVFELFRDTAADGKKKSRERTRREFFEQRTEGRRLLYAPRLRSKAQTVDRVPFLWDFGFLVCNPEHWEDASALDLEVWNAAHPEETEKKKVKHVWQELSKVIVAKGKEGEDRNSDAPAAAKGEKEKVPDPVVGWREFLEAAGEVAAFAERVDGERAMPLDIAMGRPESIACLIMEIWFSEIRKDLTSVDRLLKDGKAAGCVGAELEQAARDWMDATRKLLGKLSSSDIPAALVKLQDLIWVPEDVPTPVAGRFPWDKKCGDCKETDDKPCPKKQLLLRIWPAGSSANTEGAKKIPVSYPLQLYKTWLLLLEVLDFNRYLDEKQPFEIRWDYVPQLDAVAVRHWYKTAATPGSVGEGVVAAHAQQHGRVPVRLPGYYAMRGDWHLAVARGSRSDKLADRVLDIFSSRRANRTRLHMGVGLPTRDISSGTKIEDTRTLLKTSRKGQLPETVTYGDLVGRLGGAVEPQEGGFHWLFRTSFEQYERQSSVLLCWLHRLFTWTVEYRSKNLKTWHRQTGFHAYDDLELGKLEEVSTYPSYTTHFPDLLRGLVWDLRSACRPEAPQSEARAKAPEAGAE